MWLVLLMQTITASQHDKVLDNLLHFISLSHKKLQSLHAKVTSVDQDGRGLFPPLPEVYTGVLIAGVNVPDHAVLFERLTEKIHANASPYLVSLKAKDCNSGKSEVRRI